MLMGLISRGSGGSERGASFGGGDGMDWAIKRLPRASQRASRG